MRLNKFRKGNEIMNNINTKIDSAVSNATASKYGKEIRQAIAIYLRKRGMSNHEIADVLGVHPATVYNYIGKQPSRNFGGVFISKPKKEIKIPKANQNQIPIETRLDNLTCQVEDLCTQIAALIARLDEAKPGKRLRVI